MAVTLASRDESCGPALSLGLDHLSPTERRLFDLLYTHRPRFASKEALLRAVFGHHYEMHVLRVNVSRLRRRLRAHGWRIETAQGAYRLRAEQEEMA